MKTNYQIWLFCQGQVHISKENDFSILKYLNPLKQSYLSSFFHKSLFDLKCEKWCFFTIDLQDGLSQRHVIFFFSQCGLWCCPGQKCSHQEAEQTLPEPDPRQEGIPGVGAHEMCQSQKCKWLSCGLKWWGRTVSRKTNPLAEWGILPHSVSIFGSQ